MSKRLIILFSAFFCLIAAGSVLAQGGGRGGGRPTPGGGIGGGGAIATPSGNLNADQQAAVQATFQALATSQASSNAGNQQAAVQGTVQALATNQAGNIAATLQPLLSRTPMPMDQASFEAILATLTAQLPASDTDAASAITNFASFHLGLGITPLYAGNIDNGSTAYPEAFQEILNQLPSDVQALLVTAANSSAATYWGVFSNGAGMVAAGSCTAEQCTVTQENLVFEIATASAGLYGLYVPGAAATPDEALALIRSTYPALASYTFEPVTAQSGYAFQSTAFDVNTQSSSTGKGVLAGAVSANGQSLVYTFVGVGEGYVSLVH